MIVVRCCGVVVVRCCGVVMVVVVMMTVTMVMGISRQSCGLMMFYVPRAGMVIQCMRQQMQNGIAQHRASRKADQQLGCFLQPGLIQRKTGDTN